MWELCGQSADKLLVFATWHPTVTGRRIQGMASILATGRTARATDRGVCDDDVRRCNGSIGEWHASAAVPDTQCWGAVVVQLMQRSW